jgi:DNA repair protein RadD
MDHLFGDPKPPLKYLINVNVLTTGFDAPNVDCVVLLRPTASPGLFYQMTGRGFRLHPSKQDCLVLDYGDNILRHGPVDAIQIVERKSTGGEAPAKECPKCQTVVHAVYTNCPECGFAFPPPENSKHGSQASNEGILTGEITDTEFEVLDVAYHVHKKREAPEDAPRTMRVDYRLGLDDWQSEWVCIEHAGFARQKAMAWWRLRSPDPFPESAQRAVEIAQGGGLACTRKITVRTIAGEKYDRIIAYVLGDLPEPIELDQTPIYDESEVPF